MFNNGTVTRAVVAIGVAIGLSWPLLLVVLALLLLAFTFIVDRRSSSATFQHRYSDACAYIMPLCFYDDAGEMYCVCEDELEDEEELDYLDYAG